MEKVIEARQVGLTVQPNGRVGISIALVVISDIEHAIYDISYPLRLSYIYKLRRTDFMWDTSCLIDRNAQPMNE